MKYFLILALITSAAAHAQETTSTYKITNESELGVIVISGNSESESYSAKQLNSLVWTENTFKSELRALKTISRAQETANNWLAGLRYERALNEKFSGFIGFSLEGDFFAGFYNRRNTDIGAKYFLTKTDQTTWFLEGGYRFIHEERIIKPNTYANSARFYSELENKWSTTVSSKLWAEYLPDLKDSKAYFINTEGSISAAFNSVFSFKTSYLVKYVNKPATTSTKYTDTQLTSSLVAKF